MFLRSNDKINAGRCLCWTWRSGTNADGPASRRDIASRPVAPRTPMIWSDQSACGLT